MLIFYAYKEGTFSFVYHKFIFNVFTFSFMIRLDLFPYELQYVMRRYVPSECFSSSLCLCLEFDVSTFYLLYLWQF